MEKILVTGAAGFIGYHVCKYFLEKDINIVGIDSLNAYYAVSLKESRLNNLLKFKNFSFIKLDITDKEKIDELFSNTKFDKVIHLAAQAGVRYSITNPDTYIDTNINGFFNVINSCVKANIKHFIFASSSSVYGNKLDGDIKSHIDSDTNKPVSLYAATKKADEIIAYAYSATHKIQCTALRFFTVYGPYGRPDMAYYKFTDRILNNREINVYENGEMKRDFTYIDDIVDGIFKSSQYINKESIPYQVFNLGNGKPIIINSLISIIENKTGIKAKAKYERMKTGDVYNTNADISKTQQVLDYNPKTKIEDGIGKFIKWYKDYYHIRSF